MANMVPQASDHQVAPSAGGGRVLRASSQFWLLKQTFKRLSPRTQLHSSVTQPFQLAPLLSLYSLVQKFKVNNCIRLHLISQSMASSLLDQEMKQISTER